MLHDVLVLVLFMLVDIFLTGGAAKSIHPTTRKVKSIIEKTAGFNFFA